MEPIVVRKDEAKQFYEGPELCREYLVTEKITFGSSTLQPGETGEIDLGHPASHEVFFVSRGSVIMFVKETGAKYQLHEQDIILMPEGVSHTLINNGTTEAICTWSKAPSEL